MPSARLTDHFTLEEFTRSDTATARGIDNVPNATEHARLLRLALALEEVRIALEGPMYITSGFRCEELNQAVGGVPNSAHRLGLAADFQCPSVGNSVEVCRKILSRGAGIVFDQLIAENLRGSSWVHFGLAEIGQRPRQMVLTIDDRGTHGGLVWS